MKSGLIAINLAAIIFGSAALFGKLDVSPVWIVALRGLFATLTLLLVGIITKKGFVKVTNPTHIKLLILTGILLSIHWLTFFISVQLSGIAIATLTFATFPLFTVLIDSLERKRIPNLIELGAGLTIIVAVTLLFEINITQSELIGLIVGIFSAISFAYFGLRAKVLSNDLPTLSVSIFQNLVVALALTPFLPFTRPIPTSTDQWLFLIILGVVTTALMHQLYLFALKKLSAKICSGFIALEPVYAIAFAALFFNEALTLSVVISGVLILSSSLALLFSENSTKVFEASP